MAWMWLGAVARASEPTDLPSPPPARAGPIDPIEASVRAVDVGLVIHRGTQPGPSGRRLGRNRAVVRGQARYHLEPAAAGAEVAPTRLTLLDFAGHLAEEPRGLDEVAMGGYADGPWTPSGTTLGRVRAEGRAADTLEVLRDPEAPRWTVTVPPGVETVVIEYEVTVPRRYWPFGCANGRCSLSGAVAPLPSRPARGGVYLPKGGRVVSPAHWTVQARFADLRGYVVDGEDPTALAAAPTDPRLVDQLGGDELVVWTQPMPTPGAGAGGSAVASARDRRVEYPMVIWGRRWHRLESLHRGVRIVVLHPKARLGGRHPHEGRFELRRDAPGRMLQIAEEGLDLAGEVLGEMPLESRLVVVQAPLRSQIAQFHPAAVVVSDRAYEIFPAERFFKFHALEIARAVLEGLGHAWIRPHAEPSEALWTGGATGFALVNVWQRQRDLRDEYAQDLLRNFTFVPAVDRFLYTEQAQFAGAYFRGSDDELGPRNHALWFGHQLPTGRRIHEKLTDLLSDEQLATFYALLSAQPDRAAETLAARAYGRELDWFFDQWLGPYPAVDYAIADVQAERVGDDRRGPWRVRIEVVKDAAVPLLEPVQLLVSERGGAQHYLVWNGDPAEEEAVPGDATLADLPPRTRHVFELETATEVEAIRLDPRSRLEQTPRIPTWPGGRADNHDPRFNDRVPPKFRFIYTGFGLSIAASELLTAQTPQARVNAVTAFASFEGSLRRDLRRTGTLSVLTDRETVVAASAGANFYFLGKRNKQRRRLRLRTSFGGAWLTDAGLDPRGGARLTESVQLVDDTTAFAWWPERGHVIGATVTANQVLREVEGQPDHRYTLAVGGGWSQNFRLARDHVIATTVDMAMTFPLAGTAPEFRNLVRLGGIGGLSGYIGTEVLGRGGAWVQAEYRHLFVNDLPLNFVHLGWLRGFGGVAFGGAGSISSCAGFSDWFGADSWYGQVGYGLQAQVQALGVTPQLIRLDVAVPLVRRDRRCLGEQFPDVLAEVQGLDPDDAGALLPPVTVNLLFNHPF